ncbi:putative mitochondrial protein [Cucumis melo var. makuwa]|uniref:Putative mitochondrial protein n=1 Tax=Cucumis melo var. makuwa TaxID=1194695 RepID=A0A5D3E7K0_CUCMM|nr:putative mitochondrial protein [Cucumis melo var. makuwa]
MSENDKFNIVVLKDMGVKDSVDKIEVKAETVGNEMEQDHSGNLSKYDPSLDIPIALKKDTRFITFVKSQGYSQVHSNHTLFAKVSKVGKIVVLMTLFYLGMTSLRSSIEKEDGDEFEIKELENLKYFLGTEVAKNVSSYLKGRRPTEELLRPLLLLTRQGSSLARNPNLSIVLLYGETSVLEAIRSKGLWSEAVLKLSMRL